MVEMAVRVPVVGSSTFFCIPGAVKSPGGIVPEEPDPPVINAFSFSRVFGPTKPTCSSPCFS